MTLFSQYLEAIAKANSLGRQPGRAERQSPVEWIFYPGMLQDSPDKWWADFGLRHALHEGIDICFYKTGKKIYSLAPDARVPAMADGTLLNLSTDLLGQSMAVSYGPKKEDSAPYSLILVYSHLDPEPGLATGSLIRRGQIIARTFDTRKKNSRLLSHLHLSCILIPKPCPDTGLDWSLFSNREQVNYLNPVFL